MALLQISLFALQSFHLLFLLLHDWLPLGRLNDIAALRAVQSRDTLLRVTAIQAAPYALGLLFSAQHLVTLYPGWLRIYLIVAYGLLFLGELQAWWVPYLLWPQPQRAERYRAMFGNTHSFLPQRNGITPNTLHVVLHSATLATLVLLFAA